MLLHVGGEAVGVLQKPHVAKLVELVVADDGRSHALLDFGDIVGACGDGRDASSRKCYLRRGRELEVTVGIARFSACLGDVEKLVLVGLERVQVMDAIGVVPEDAEIVSSAGHGRQATNDFLGIGDAPGVGVLGDAPDALHGLVLGDDSLDLIHIRAVFVHLHGNHLDAERLRDAEVTVVTRNRADPFDAGVLRPGLAAEGAEVEASRNGVAHERQARVAADDHIFRYIIEHRCQQALRLGKTVEHTVVATIGAVLGDAILRA